MKTKEFLTALCLFLGVTFLFFYPSFLKGHLPFPGDLLVGHYTPWNTYSYLGFASGGVPHKAQGIDVVRQSFPWRYFSTQTLKNGKLPLWNPYNFSGNPHLANFQTGVFYPLNTLFLILDTNLAWTIFIILQPLLTCLFTYLFLREIKLSWRAAVFASVSFAYCLYLTVWLEWGNIGHTILWLPLALFLVEKIIKKLKWRWVALLVFSLASSILAGYIQTTIYLFAVVYAYFFYRLLSVDNRREKVTRLIAVFASGLISLLLCAIQFLPTWEIFQRSAREAYPYEKISQLLLPWFDLIVSFVPDFFGNPASRNYWLPGTYIERVAYIGVLPLFFAFLVIFRRKKTKISLFFIGLAALVLLLTLNLPPARFFYGLKIPIISTTVPTRLLYVFAFSMAVLAGFGVDEYFKNKKKSIKAPAVFLGFYLFLWLFTFLAPKVFPNHWWVVHLEVTRRNLILPTGFAFLGMFLVIFSTHWSKKPLIFWGIVLVTVFDLFFYFKKITPFSPPEFVYPETEVMAFFDQNAGINRFWGYGSGYIDTNFSTYTRTFSSDGYDPLFIRRYGELISASEDGKIKKPIPRADVVLAKGYGQEALRENPYRQRLLNLLGVKYLLQRNDGLDEKWQPDYQTFPPEIYQLVWQQSPPAGGWQIYENRQALPRIFLVGGYQVEQQRQAIVDLIFDSEFPLEEKVILEKPLPADFILGKSEIGQVELLDYQPNKVEIKTSALENKLLFFSDNFYPGWQAAVDDEPTEIYRANYSFRVIFVPGGEHQVTFEFKPKSFDLGLRLTLVSLTVIIVIVLSSPFIFRTKNEKS